MTKIYTKTGDRGTTGLFGAGRVDKHSPRIEAYGTVDELNSFIGLTIVEIKDSWIKSILDKIQNELFTVGSNLASPDTEKNKNSIIPPVKNEFIEDAEKAIDYAEERLEPLKNFILPGGSRGAALLHICRTVCRRAERRVTKLNSDEKVSKNIIIFLNRLSDLFFILARYENAISNVPDIKWNKED
jgi:cob(I)alamin adenosyltransferase